MHLFKKKDSESLASPALPKQDGKLGKWRTLFKGSPKVENLPPENFEKLLILDSTKNGVRRISTIVDAHSGLDTGLDTTDDSDFDSEVSENQYDDDDDDGNDGDDDDDDEDLPHTHALKERGKKLTGSHLQSQIINIMEYCGVHTGNPDLRELANEELKRTYSLLDAKAKIFQLSSCTKKDDSKLFESVIGNEQAALIDIVKRKLLKVVETKSDPKNQKALFGGSKTLFDRYGAVRDVIGRGSYGLIKVVDSQADRRKLEGRSVYAVKELLQRDEKSKESPEAYIDRVLSEFIISSTLNYKNIVKTVDLMVTLGSQGEYKLSQVMECTSGSDLFSYITNSYDKGGNRITYVAPEEIDCFIKQVSKGLCYMHNHGVAHCDLKLENILLSFHPETSNVPNKGTITIKISDFGKSNVFRTKWDSQEELFPYLSGPIGSGPYIAPEEYLGSYATPKRDGYSLSRKDCWSLGVVALVLFNIRKHSYNYGRNTHSGSDDDDELTLDECSSGYLWKTTEFTVTGKDKHIKYKDKIFDEFMKNRLITDYDTKTKEWTIKRNSTFRPINDIFSIRSTQEIERSDNVEEVLDDESNELRRLFIYKLLDPDPSTRLSVKEFLKGDWMATVDCCV